MQWIVDKEKVLVFGKEVGGLKQCIPSGLPIQCIICDFKA